MTCECLMCLAEGDNSPHRRRETEKLTDQMRAERGSLDAAKQAIELAYGLLWLVGCDRSTKNGQALYLARKALYERLDRDGQARGITAARKALEAAPPPLPAWREP